MYVRVRIPPLQEQTLPFLYRQCSRAMISPSNPWTSCVSAPEEINVDLLRRDHPYKKRGRVVGVVNGRTQCTTMSWSRFLFPLESLLSKSRISKSFEGDGSRQVVVNVLYTRRASSPSMQRVWPGSGGRITCHRQDAATVLIISQVGGMARCKPLGKSADEQRLQRRVTL